MNKKVVIAFGVLVLAFAVLAGGMYYKTRDVLNTAPVVVTVQDIPEQTAIQPEMVKTIEIPVKYIPPNVIQDATELEGKWTMAGYGLSKNSYLYRDKLVNEQDMIASMMAKAKQNERLISITVDLPSSLGGKVARGDIIELWFSYKGNQKKPAYAGRLLNRVEVIALQDTQGKDIVPVSNTDANKNKGMMESVLPSGLNLSNISSVPRLLTIKVPEEMVEYILLAQNTGKLIVVGKANVDPNEPIIGEAKYWLEKFTKRGDEH